MIKVGAMEREVVRYLRNLVSFALLVSAVFLYSSKANACCVACFAGDCAAADEYVKQAHRDLRSDTEFEFLKDLFAYELWLEHILFNSEIAVATNMFLTQMNAVAMEYTMAVGTFLDAQVQMDTQRLYRRLQFEAHKDYTPSQTFCYFGTNVRSLLGAEARGRHNALALSKMALDRQLGAGGMAGSAHTEQDYKARWYQFVSTYCDPRDNNFQTSHAGNTGLVLACGAGGAGDDNRFNRDINYTRLIERPRTLNIDLSNETLNVTVEPQVTLLAEDPTIRQPGDEEDIIAMSKNLYGSKILSRGLTKSKLSQEGEKRGDGAKRLYLMLRSIAAKRNVAQASFNAIVALKSSGASDLMLETVTKPTATGSDDYDLETKQTRRFLAAIMHELLPAKPNDPLDLEAIGGNIFNFIGYSPSYFAQLEILAKRMYQNPDFYAHLYESPANVSRKKVAMKAIELMVDRAIYESQIRREMSISVLLSSKLRAMHRDANKAVAVKKGQKVQ